MLGKEFVDAAKLVNEAHLTSEERVAFGADIHGKIGLRGACLEGSTTAAGNGDLVVGLMDLGFHRVKL